MSELVEEHGLAAGNVSEHSLRKIIEEFSEKTKQNVRDQLLDKESAHFQINYEWGESEFRVVPENFTLPSVDLHDALPLWWEGNTTQKLLPYRAIPFDHCKLTKTRKELSEWQVLMKELLRLVKEEDPNFLIVKKPTQVQYCKLEEMAFRQLSQEKNESNSRRIRQWRILTIAKQFKKIRKRKNNDSSSAASKRQKVV